MVSKEKAELFSLVNLRVRNFRIIEDLVIEPDSGLNVIHGPNGAGKSTLIEAIYLMGSLRSFRMASVEGMIGRNSSEARVEADFRRDTMPSMTGKVILSGKGKRVTLSGKAPDSGHFRRLPMVLFHPEQIEIVFGGPVFRRRFVDRICVQQNASYQKILGDYSRALRSRNRLLKSGAKHDLLDAYDGALAAAGSRITKIRGTMIEALRKPLSEIFKQITRGLECDIEYRPDINEGDDGEILKILYDARKTDRIRGNTTRGPHRDDVEFSIDGNRAKAFASHGQARAVVLSLKMAEYRMISGKTGRRPILLLDDVLGELDGEKHRSVMDFVNNSKAQVFITTAVLQDKLSRMTDRITELKNGRIEKHQLIENV